MSNKSIFIGLFFLISLTEIAGVQIVFGATQKTGVVDDTPSRKVQPKSAGLNASSPTSVPSCAPLEPPQDKTAIARIASLFGRPTSLAGLLQNFKIAYDRKLLLVPEFYDEGNLLKFFGSARVVSTGHRQPEMPGNADRVIELAGGDKALGRWTVSLMFSCLPQPEYDSPTGVVPAHTRRLGGATVTVAAAPDLTVNRVRAVLGRESRFLPEQFGPHDLRPTGEGLLIYENPADYRNGRTTKAGAEITFRITLSLAGRGPEHATEPLFTGNDVVEGVEIFQSER
jgi:hypothetical protein